MPPELRHLETVEYRFTLPIGAAAAFRFFSDPRKLDLVTPEWFRPRLRSVLPERLSVGTTVDYSMAWHWLPLRWRSIITELDPPSLLVCEQAKGPFRSFRHEHVFTPLARGVDVVDRIAFTTPLAPLLSTMLRPMLRHQLAGILACRARLSADLLSQSAGSFPIGPGSEPGVEPHSLDQRLEFRHR